MIATLKSEFRKVYTIRSTYGVLAFVLLMLGIFAFYVDGIKGGAAQASNPELLATEVRNAISVTSIFASLIGAFLVTHEYRYNTINYTLTLTKRRLQVLLAKIIVVSVFAVIFALAFGALSPLFTYAGLSIRGVHLVGQTIYFRDVLWQAPFVCWGYSMLALVFATVIRNQVGTLAMIFLFEGTVESLLALVLKGNAVYLPYKVLNAVISGGATGSHLTAQQNAGLFLAYIAGAWLVASVLFVHRDAS
jgi:ABC-2 type transport system permease protein